MRFPLKNFFKGFVFSTFKTLIYFWLLWVSAAVRASSSCSGRASGCGARLWGAQASAVAWARYCVHGLTRSAACGTFPDQGSNPCPLHRQADSHSLYHEGSPPF